MRNEHGILSINTSESIDENNGSFLKENTSLNIHKGGLKRKNSIKTKENVSTDFG